MIWHIIDLFVDIIDALIIVRFCNVHFHKRFNRKEPYYIGYMLIVFIIFLSNLYFNSTDELMKNSAIITTFIVFGLIYILYYDNVIKLVGVYLGLNLFVVTIEGLTISLLSIILNQSTFVFVSNTIYKFLVIVIAKLITFLIVEIVISKYKTNRVFQIKTSLILYIIFLFIINLAIMISVVFIFAENDENIISGGYIVLGLGIINVLSLLIYESVFNESDKYWKMQLKMKQYDMQSKYYDEVNYATMKLKSLRHDMSNHLGNIKGLVVYKEYAKLEEYLNKLLSGFEEIDKIIITKYPAISALLNRKYALAEKNNINCSMNLDCAGHLNIDDVDLCIILGNLLDNAIEANMKIDNSNRYIKLDIHCKNNYIVIDCVNSTINNGNISLMTTKENKGIHGIGLKNVKEIVEKYHGNTEITRVKDYFSINVMLYNGEIS